MASSYQMQVVERGSGKLVAAWPPGLDEERDLIETIVTNVKAKQVGVFRSEAHVLASVRSAVEDALLTLKRNVRR